MSALALALALGCQPAAAEDARFIFEARGGWLTGDEQPWAFTTSDNVVHDIDASSLFGGTVGIVAPAGDVFAGFDDWDVGLFTRLGISDKEGDQQQAPFLDSVIQLIGGFGPPGDFTFGRVEHREYQTVIDLEARRPVSWMHDRGGKTTLRLGARFAYFNARTKTNFIDQVLPFLTAQDDRKSEFIGAGPRIALDTSIPLHERTWLDLSAGASLLLGQRNTTNVTTGADFLGPLDATFSRSSFRIVPALEARAALKFAMANAPATLSVGVEANAWFGIYDTKTTFGPAPLPGEQNADRFEISPFVNLTTPLGGDPFAASPSDAPQTAFFGGRGIVLEGGLWGGGNWRNGNALNSSGGTPDELDSFALAGLDVLAAFSLHDGWIAQAEFAGELRLGSNTTTGTLVDDTFDGGLTAGGQLAWTRGPLLLAAFGGAGITEIATDNPPDQGADHWLAGVQGRVMGERHAFAVQVGHLDTSADDEEVISDALFGRLIGQAFFNDGRTKLQGDFAYASGDQDPDDPFPFPTTPVTVTSWGLEIEHQLDRRIGNASIAPFLAYQGAHVRERSSSGEIDALTDTTILAGVRIRTGVATPLERARRTAPDLPNVVRWIGTVPAID